MSEITNARSLFERVQMDLNARDKLGPEKQLLADLRADFQFVGGGVHQVHDGSRRGVATAGERGFEWRDGAGYR
jgi:hypothetical protein